MRIGKGARKLAVVGLLGLNVLLLPFSFAADPEIISASEAASLGLEIPSNTPAGNQIVTIEVTDADGNTVTRDIAFCKGADGKVYWNNICPEVAAPTPSPSESVQPTPEPTPEPTPAEVPAPVIDPINPPPYDPASEPTKTANTIVAGFAALAAVGAAGAVSTSNSNSNNGGSADGPAELESLEHGELARAQRKKEGRGDRSRSWRFPGTSWVDNAFDRWVERTSRFSPLLGRMLMDNSYLQAMFGSASMALYPIAFFLGAAASHSIHNNPVPPTIGFIFAIVILGIFDAFAGFIAGTRFILGVIAAGNLTTRQDFFAMVGVSILFFGPVLIASAFRPFRREVSDGNERWERVTDIFLATLVGGWVTKKIIDGLNGLGGKQYVITNHSTTIAVWVGAAILLRLAMEEIALRHYPARLEKTTPHLKSPSRNQQIISLALKIDMFIFLGEPFIGHTKYLWMATFLFGAPQLFHIFLEEKLPQSSLIHRVIPKGAVNVVVMVFVGTFFAKFLQGQFSSATSFVKWSFVLLGLPGLVLSIVEWFADGDAEFDWNEKRVGKVFYRFAGIIVAGLFVMVVTGRIS